MSVKRNRKRPFLLVEALICITLLFGVGFAFFEIQSAIGRKARQTEQLVEAEIAYQLALSQLVQDLYDKKFEDEIDRKSIHFVDVRETKEWKVRYNFSRYDPKDTQASEFLIYVTIDELLHDRWNSFPFQGSSFTFCVRHS